MSERKAMIKGHQRLSVSRQCHLLAVPRSSVYARPRGVSAADVELMRQLDELYLQWPFYGSRRLCEELCQRGERVNRKRVRRLMRLMGLRAVYPKPRTSQPGKGHKIYPYLLNGLTIDRPNQVWASDICYVPMAKGFMYLTVIMDWYSRRVLAWRVSNTLDADPCIAALEEALARYGPPEILNTDQGAQYTSEAFTEVLRSHNIHISMDGKGRWVDNVFVERLWRSVKYEDIYLRAYESPAALRKGLTQYFQFYNTQRRHQTLNRQTPDAVYFEDMKEKTVAS
jgi:putative transposase